MPFLEIKSLCVSQKVRWPPKHSCSSWFRKKPVYSSIRYCLVLQIWVWFVSVWLLAMDVFTKALGLNIEFGFETQKFIWAEGARSSSLWLSPCPALLVRGLCICHKNRTHLEAAFMEKFLFIHVMNVPACKLQTGAAHCVGFSHNFSRYYLRYIYVACMALTWLSLL